jgi:four helix bundle protein
VATPRSLKAWQHARTLAIACAEAADLFPITERFALAQQLRRAAYSVLLNIAEGATRYGQREFRKFLDTSRSSLDEIESILEIAIARHYVTPTLGEHLQAVRDETARTVFGLLRAVSRRQPDHRAHRAGRRDA